MAVVSLSAQTRFGIRSLSKTPLVTCVALLSIALAVGLTAVTLSVVYGTTLRPLPFAGGERIMSVELAALSGDGRVDFEALELRDFRDRQTSFEALEGYFQRRVTLQNNEGRALSLNAGVVTAVMRSRETTIRTALGAGRAEITAQFLIESLVLSVSGALLGIGLAAVGMMWVEQVTSRFSLPYWAQIRLDPPVLVVTAVSAVLLALVVGLLSAWQSSRSGIGSIQRLSRSSMTSLQMGRVGRVLVTAQIAVSCALLVGAGLLVSSLIHVRTLDLGFDPDRVMTARQLVVGTTVGLVLGSWLARSIRAVLFEVGAVDPIVYAAVASALVLTGVLASVLSARKIGRVAPSEILG